MEVYRISPIGYVPERHSVLLKKDNEGKGYIFSIRIWVEISEDNYHEILNNVQNDEEHFEITQIL